MTILTSVFAVLTAVFEAMRGWLVSVVELFIGSNGELTFFGTLALVSLGISIFFLLMRVVQNFLHFRG